MKDGSMRQPGSGGQESDGAGYGGGEGDAKTPCEGAHHQPSLDANARCLSSAMEVRALSVGGGGGDGGGVLRLVTAPSFIQPRVMTGCHG